MAWRGVVRALLDLVNDERTRPGRRAAETAMKREERGARDRKERERGGNGSFS